MSTRQEDSRRRKLLKKWTEKRKELEVFRSNIYVIEQVLTHHENIVVGLLDVEGPVHAVDGVDQVLLKGRLREHVDGHVSLDQLLHVLPVGPDLRQRRLQEGAADL